MAFQIYPLTSLTIRFQRSIRIVLTNDLYFMKPIIQIAAAAFFVISLSAGTANSQSPVPETGPGAGPIPPHTGELGFIGAPGSTGAMDYQFGARHKGLQVCWAQAEKFLENDKYRASLEAKMSAADKQKVETAVAEIKNDITTLKGDRSEFKAAHLAHDTATLHQLLATARPVFEQIREDRTTIMDILKKYKSASSTIGNAPVIQPIYPNPIHIGGTTPATISYTLKTESNVTIELCDASGRVVQEISSGIQPAGDHSVTIGSELTAKPGAYYVTIETGSTKTTQKIVAVE